MVEYVPEEQAWVEVMFSPRLSMVGVCSFLEHDLTNLVRLAWPVEAQVDQYEVKYQEKVQKGKDVPLLMSLANVATDEYLRIPYTG